MLPYMLAGILGVCRFLQDLLESILDLSPEVTGPAQQLVEAIDFVSSEEKAKARKQMMANRYQVDKAQRALHKGGGFPANYARRLATFLHHQEDPTVVANIEMASCVRGVAGKFDSEHICQLGAWTDNAQDGAVKVYVQKMMELVSAHVEKKAADVLKTMKKKEWQSAMSRCDTCFSEHCDIGMGDEAAFACDPGAGPWVVGIASHAWRWGPEDTPLPGVPLIIVAKETPLLVSTFLLGPLLEQGLAPADLKSFLSTPSGVDYVKEYWTVSLVQASSSIYVPAGHLPMVTFVPAKSQEPSCSGGRSYMGYPMQPICYGWPSSCRLCYITCSTFGPGATGHLSISRFMRLSRKD